LVGLPLCGALLLASCGGEGSFVATIYGEAFVESGIPEEVFVDGWSVTFDSFLVVVGEVEAGDAYVDPQFRLVDLAVPSDGAGQELSRGSLAAGKTARFAYRIAPSPDALALGVDPDTAAMIRDAGYSIYVEGEGRRGDASLRFAWGFTTDTTYDPCEIDVDLEAGGQGGAEITVHADHLFYDDLDSEEPNVAFDALAAADALGDGDGVVTEGELRAFDITAEARYQVGSRDIVDLWGFLSAQTRTVGHVDGEGHCTGAT